MQKDNQTTYTVVEGGWQRRKVFTDASAAARSFWDATAEASPYLIRVERLPNGRESASVPGQTSYTERCGVRVYHKWIGGHDEALNRAYAELGETPALFGLN